MEATNMDALLRELARMTGIHHLRDEYYGLVMDAINVYSRRDARFGKGGVFPRGYMRIYIYGTLWNWYEALKRTQIQNIDAAVFDVVSSGALMSPIDISRTDVAFLVGWRSTAKWLKGFGVTYPSAFALVWPDLVDLLSSPWSTTEVMQAFFGVKRLGTEWQHRRLGLDVDSVVDELGIQISEYTRMISPHETRIYGELCNSIPGFDSP